MQPVVTPKEMGAIDAVAPEPVEELIERAGWAVAVAALRLLGRGYGRRVLVIAGKGNNGADGRSAARFLTRRGVRCEVVAPDDAVSRSGQLARRGFDLVIDAAYGTGFRGENVAPSLGDVPVLAVDVPSGVNGLTGEVGGQALSAVETVTFAALKPGLLFEPGRSLAGTVRVADIGLDCGRARAWRLGADDLARWPTPEPTTHKWRRAIWVIGGGPGMVGAPAMAAAGAARAGAGLVALSVPGSDPSSPLFGAPIETVQRPLPAVIDPGRGGSWARDALEALDRFSVLVIGPGLPVDGATRADVRAVVSAAGDVPIVLDGGAIDAVLSAPRVLATRSVPAVLTPHDGEFVRLMGSSPGDDRIAAARGAAARLGAVVVLKGPTTVAAHPDGRAFVSTAGDRRLGSAGTGDVLAGVIGAGLAGGLHPLDAAGLGAELHGRAALAGHDRGFTASDLPLLIAELLDTVAGEPVEQTEPLEPLVARLRTPPVQRTVEGFVERAPDAGPTVDPTGPVAAPSGGPPDPTGPVDGGPGAGPETAELVDVAASGGSEPVAEDVGPAEGAQRGG